MEDKSMSIIEVHNVMPAETEQQVEDADPMLVDLPAVEATLPLPEAKVTYGTRRPCYGWIKEYESESDNEEQPARLICKRKRPSRWDVKPINW